VFLSKKEKTVTRSFRISESALQALEEDARSRNISLNTLVNQLLLAYTNWGRFIDRVGPIRTTKSAFNLILNAASDEAILEAARFSGPDTPKSIILSKHGVLSVKTVLDYVRSATMYGGYAQYSEIESQGKTVITLMHDLGRKGSVFISSVLESILGMVDIHYVLSSSEHSVIIEI
jgi:hypothetical protein